MFRKTIRTSYRLVRRQINSSKVNNPYPCFLVLRKSDDNPVKRPFSSIKSDNIIVHEQLDPIVFDHMCSETLESLCDYFEELIERAPNLKGADVTYGDGVLTVALGSTYGTYVINRQTPNKQIWLSSPTTGPKRYDLVTRDGGYWIYKHNGVSLHQLLQEEISKIANTKVDFKSCAHSRV